MVKDDLKLKQNQLQEVNETNGLVLEELSKVDKIEEKKEHTMKKDVVLFFSFDVVNSTAYKTINYYGWAQALNVLFKELREKVKRSISNSEMWRVLGDEAIFIVRVQDEEKLRKDVNEIFKIMVSTISELKHGKFFPVDNMWNLTKLQNILSLKAAAWIAAVSDVGDISNTDILQKDADNIFERYRTQGGYEIFEFLGNDIDAGFRIAKETQEGRLVLSYELAYLISQKTENSSYLHIITYKKLKGIWKDKLYPIIWYHNPKGYDNNKELQFVESFTFDICDNNDLIKEYYDNRNPNKVDKIIQDIKMYTEPYYALSKILIDRGLEEKVKGLQKLIGEIRQDQTKYINPELMQIHCVAVCFKWDGKDIKILVAKRTKQREKHKGEWEFGCAKAVIDKTIAEKIKEEYKQDFGIDIEPVLDEKRKMKEPVPIALYHIKHSKVKGKQDKGIITLAEIIGDCDLEKLSLTDKHEKVQWVMESDLENVDELFKESVPDFKQTLEQAFIKIRLLKGILDE